MAGNSFGEIFRFTTFGESHGAAIGVIVDGVPAGIPLDISMIQLELDRRRPGQSKLTREKRATRQKSSPACSRDLPPVPRSL